MPNARKAPAPVFVGMNFHGNHALVSDPMVRLPTVWVPDKAAGVKDNRATDAGRGTEIDVWALEQSIDRGYAVATFYCGDIDPDRPDVREGIQPHFLKPGQEPEAHDWGTIRGLGLGHFAGRRLSSSPTRTWTRTKSPWSAIPGSARRRSWPAAFDERIALVIPLQAGCGGTAPSRNQPVERNRSSGSTPVSRTGSTARSRSSTTSRTSCRSTSIAWRRWWRPGRVLYCNAVEDKWANPEGQFEMLKSADSVYRLLGAGGLETKQMPEIGQAERRHARLLHPTRQALDDEGRLEGVSGLRRQAFRGEVSLGRAGSVSDRRWVQRLHSGR